MVVSLLESENVGPGHVLDVNIVPHHSLRLARKGEEGDRLGVDHSLMEDRHDSRLSLRNLPRAVDVSVTQNHIGDTVTGAKVADIVFCGHLSDSVGGLGIRKRLFPIGVKGSVAVDRPSGRGEEKPLDSGFQGGF